MWVENCMNHILATKIVVYRKPQVQTHKDTSLDELMCNKVEAELLQVVVD